ncbi:MAG: exodeoxyribonuclease III [Gammaproteobacteria bacterium]|nr:exodeoxyribonuclease III [Gammaproteobacteria bacterium]
MKIASWNVNSLKVRLPQVLDWLETEQPDVLGLQETKLTDDKFPVDELREAGYHVDFYGQKTYNGVALLSREPGEDIVKGMPGLEDPQARVIIGTFGGVRVANLYVPNGSEVGSEKYDYKLGWLDYLSGVLADERKQHDRMVVMGDFNIAPADADVHDPEEWRGKILFSEPEHAALKKILDLGFTDSYRLFEQEPDTFSWWDYRAAGFRRNRGLRIDLLLLSDALREKCEASWIDREPRTWERPSDHAPVLVNITM